MITASFMLKRTGNHLAVSTSSELHTSTLLCFLPAVLHLNPTAHCPACTPGFLSLVACNSASSAAGDQAHVDRGPDVDPDLSTAGTSSPGEACCARPILPLIYQVIWSWIFHLLPPSASHVSLCRGCAEDIGSQSPLSTSEIEYSWRESKWIKESWRPTRHLKFCDPRLRRVQQPADVTHLGWNTSVKLNHLYRIVKILQK